MLPSQLTLIILSPFPWKMVKHKVSPSLLEFHAHLFSINRKTQGLNVPWTLGQPHHEAEVLASCLVIILPSSVSIRVLLNCLPETMVRKILSTQVLDFTLHDHHHKE